MQGLELNINWYSSYNGHLCNKRNLNNFGKISIILICRIKCYCSKFSLFQDDDRRRGGLTLSRYQELYAQFLGNPNENPAVYLFGPLSEIPMINYE